MESAPPRPVDRISNMPEPIIDDILMRLTTPEAAKISILSKQWRYKWAKLPHLIFENALRKGSESPQDAEELEESDEGSKFLLFLDQVLLHHEGPTRKLSFVVPKLKSYSRIDRLINLLTDHGVEEFTLKLSDKYNLPSCLFTYSRLKHLKLDSCSINPPPPTFKGFNKLVSLELNSVIIHDEVIESLISSCPMLEHLVLTGDSEFEHLGIDAPLLKFFVFACKYGTIYFKRAPCLETVTVFVYRQPEVQHGNFIDFFDSLPALCNLFIDAYSLRVLVADQVPARLPASLVHLKTLEIPDICLDELEQFSCVLSLIRSSPNLEELEILICGWEAPDKPIIDFLDVQDFSDVLLDKLKVVDLTDIDGTVSEMALIKLLLEKSPKLESMVIRYRYGIHCNSKKGRRIVKKVNSFEPLSPYANIIHNFMG